MKSESRNMLLCIDIGNSTIGFGIFRDPAKGGNPIIRKIPTHPAVTISHCRKIINGLLKEAAPGKGASKGYTVSVIISSVVPSLNKTMLGALEAVRSERPVVVSSRLDFGFSLKISGPEKMGADRVANAVAGYHLMKGPVAVVDFGTATTITVAGKDREILGGAILPGIELMQLSLFAGTAKLPLIPLDAPASALGKDTVSSIAAGILYGTAAAVEGLLKGMEKELKFRLRLVLTGGHAARLSPLITRRHRISPALVFEGLRLIYLALRSAIKK